MILINPFIYKMDFILRKNLPIELVENIMRDVHTRYMKELEKEIQHNVVWIRTNQGEYSFLIGKTTSYPYYLLRDNISANFKCKKQNLKCIINRKYIKIN